MRNELEFGADGTNKTKGGIRGQKPAPKKLLGRYVSLGAGRYIHIYT